MTSLERTVLDLAASEPATRVRLLLEAAQRRDLLAVRRIEAEIAASNGHRGVGVLRAALLELDDEPPSVRSSLEARFLELVRGSGLPQPIVNVLVADELIDARWPGHDLVVEVDSWAYHRSRRAFEADRRRDNRLTLTGQRLLRFTDTRIAREPDAVIAELRAAFSVTQPQPQPGRPLRRGGAAAAGR